MFSKIAAVTFAAIASTVTAWAPTAYQINVDNSTYANADQIHTTHYHVDWTVNFDTSQLIGSVTHDLKVLQDTNYVVFDTWNINIDSAE